MEEPAKALMAYSRHARAPHIERSSGKQKFNSHVLTHTERERERLVKRHTHTHARTHARTDQIEEQAKASRAK